MLRWGCGGELEWRRRLGRRAVAVEAAARDRWLSWCGPREAEQAGTRREQGTRERAGQRAGTDRREGEEEEENKEQRTPRRRGTQKKDKKEKHGCGEQTVPVGGGREEWVECEWVSTCVLGLILDLDLASNMLARFA